MKVSNKKDNPLIVSCSKSVLEDFHLQKFVGFFLQERQLFDRFIKILSSSKLRLEDSYLHPIIFKTHYISFWKQGTYWKQCIYQNKRSIVNPIIKGVEIGYCCWNLIKSTTNEICVPVVKFPDF